MVKDSAKIKETEIKESLMQGTENIKYNCKACGGEAKLERTCCGEKRAGFTRVIVCTQCHHRNYPQRSK